MSRSRYGAVAPQTAEPFRVRSFQSGMRSDDSEEEPLLESSTLVVRCRFARCCFSLNHFSLEALNGDKNIEEMFRLRKNPAEPRILQRKFSKSFKENARCAGRCDSIGDKGSLDQRSTVKPRAHQ